MSTLIVYFSAEFGITAKLAERVKAITGADLFEIKPEKPYTKADVNYRNPLSRCNKEFFAKKDVPAAAYPENFGTYDTILIGLPIWYGCAPLAVSSFCKKLDFAGKKVGVIATSGGSKIGKTAEKLKPFVPGATAVKAEVFNNASDEELKSWIESL